MAQDIVSSLFGLSPYQVAQQQQREIDTDAAKFAQMPAAQRGAMGLYQGGAGLAGMAGGMLGIENPAVVEAQQRQAALQGLDISSPESILARAQQLQDPKLKMQLMMVARDAQAKQQQLATEAAKMKLAERKQDFQETEAMDLKRTQVLENIRLKEKQLEQEAAIARAKGESDAAYKAQLLELRRLGLQIQQSKQGQQGMKLSGFDAKSIERSDKAAEAANPALQLLDQAEQLYGRYESSRTEPIMGSMARVGAAIGLGSGERAADFEKAGQIAKDLGVIKLGLIGGSDTERELQVAIDTSPSPDKTVAANLEIIANQKKAINILQSEPDFKREWIDRNGSLARKDATTGESYGAAWRKFQKANFSGATEKPAQPMSGADAQALSWANANPNDPRSVKIKAKLGVK